MTTENFAAKTTLSPRLDIYENEDELLVLADLPAVNAGEIQLSVEKGILTLSASRYGELEGGRSGVYERGLKLPHGVDSNQIAASYEEGVLRLSLPKSPSRNLPR